MNRDRLSQLKVLDCTFRDGGHVTNWQFDERIVRRAYRASSLAGVDYFEVGYRVGRSYPGYEKVGAWARCRPDFGVSEKTQAISGI